MAAPSPSGPGTSRAALLSAAQAFCEAFATKSTPPAELVSKFFASSSSSSPGGSGDTGNTKSKVDILAFEHALVGVDSPQSRARELLPFLGRPFRGKDGVRAYFEAVGGLLDYRDMRFDFGGGNGGSRTPRVDDEECGFSPFVVDVEGRQVCVKGKARFSCKATGQEWDESFIYKLGYVFEEGEDGTEGAWKVLRFEVWADPAAAYLAAKGEL